jgi:hypothetical protein
MAVIRASCLGFFEIFVNSAFGGVASVVVVVPVVVVPVVVVPPEVVPVPDVVVPAPAVVVTGFFPAPGFDVFAAALVAAPLPGLVLVVDEVLPETFGDWPWLVGAVEVVVVCLPPFGAAPDLPCAATGVTLTAAIVAAVAKSRNSFICVSPPQTWKALQEQCLTTEQAKDNSLRQLRGCSTTVRASHPQNCEQTFEVGSAPPMRPIRPRRLGEDETSS